jgi:hypothetical protein
MHEAHFSISELSQVLQFYPPLHGLHSPTTKLKLIGHDVQDLLELHERSGAQTPLASRAYPPMHELQLSGLFSEHYLHGSLHCSVQLLLTNLNPGRHSIQFPLVQFLHLGGQILHCVTTLLALRTGSNPKPQLMQE